MENNAAEKHAKRVHKTTWIVLIIFILAFGGLVVYMVQSGFMEQFKSEISEKSEKGH